MHSSNFYRTWHTVVNAFIYMTVGALDFRNGVNQELYIAQRPGPWDRDSNIVAGDIYFVCNVCYSKILCGRTHYKYITKFKILFIER